MKTLQHAIIKICCLAGFLFFMSCQDDNDVKPKSASQSMTMEEADQITKDYFRNQNSGSNARTTAEAANASAFKFEAKTIDGPDKGKELNGTLSFTTTSPFGEAVKYRILSGTLALSNGTNLTLRGVSLETVVYVFFDDANGKFVFSGYAFPNANGSLSGLFGTVNASTGTWKATPIKLPSIVEIAASDSRFTTLVSALQATDLVGALSGAGPFTVFAPTNDAFAKLSSIPGGDALKEILLYHVAAGQFTADALLKLGKIKTLQGREVTIEKNANGEVILNKTIKVIIANIFASNGIIHVIDAVLIPPAPLKSIVEIAAGDPQFSTLVSALTSADLVGALSGKGPFTVFAPTNNAFAKLSSIPGGDALVKVLLYHVASGKLNAADLIKAGEVITLEGNTVHITINDKKEVIINGSVKVIAKDIEASNGIIHVIDAVLMPPIQSIVEIAAGNPDFSTLVSALQTAGLVEALSGPGPFTVFAPTNAAFAKLSQIPGGEALRNVLLYHVVSGKIKAKDLAKLTRVSTLLGKNVKVRVNKKGEIILNNAIKIIAKDIVATNGVIHVIDAVLIP